MFTFYLACLFKISKIYIFWYSDLIKIVCIEKFNNEWSKSKKTRIFKRSWLFFQNASEHADEGDLQSCAGLILKALDKERMAGGVGPQVLHLIKTR